MSVESKINLARVYIRRAIDEQGGENCAVACSWGKDSVLVLYLVREVFPDVKVVFCNTGIEFPETLELRDRLVQELRLNYHEARPEVRFGAIVRQYGLPHIRATGSKKTEGQRTPKCCELLKEKPALKMYRALGVKCVFTGITSDESRNRFMLSCRMGKYYKSIKENYYKCHPIMDLTEAEVFEASALLNIPLNQHYIKFPGHRVGCAPCTAYLSWEDRMPIESPRWYRYVQKVRGQKLFEDFDDFEIVK